MGALPLETARLTLRPYAPSDIPALVPLIGAREVAATTLRIPHPYTEDYAREFIAGAQADLASGDGLRLGMIIRETGALCGGIGLRIDADHCRAELGYWIGVPYWGNGYATESAIAVVRYGFETLKLHRIFASHTTNNPASGKVLQKIGMQNEGRMRSHILKWGEFLDLEMYGMLASNSNSPTKQNLSLNTIPSATHTPVAGAESRCCRPPPSPR